MGSLISCALTDANSLSFDKTGGVTLTLNLDKMGNDYGSSAPFADQEAGGYGGMSPDSFGDKAVRLGFIRKVYAILSAQLAVTLAIIGVFMIPSVQKFSAENQWLYILAEGFMIGTITSHYKVSEVMIAVGVTSAVVLALTIFAFQTKIDFTAMGGWLNI